MHFKIIDIIASELQCVFFIVWITGILIKSILYYQQLWRMKKIIERSRKVFQYDSKVEHISKLLKFDEKIQVYKSKICMSPAVYKDKENRLIMPEYLLLEDEIDIILTHEILHLKHKDIYVKRFLKFMNILFWFHPIVYLYMNEFECWNEIICDYNVYKILRYDKKMYAQLLMNIATLQNDFKEYSMVHFNKNYKSLEKRLKCMKKFRLRKFNVAFLLSVVFFSANVLPVYAVDSTLIKKTNEKIELKNSIESKVIANDEKEYEDFVNDENKTIIEKTEDVEMYGSGGVEWKVPSKTIYTTSSFYVAKGSSILVSAKVIGSDKKVNVGIVQSNGRRKYVIANKTTHEFLIDSSGIYRVFVENTTASAIDINVVYVY